MSKILDPNGFKNAVDFVMQPLAGNPVWSVVERIDAADHDGTLHFCYHDDGVELISNETGNLLDTIYLFVLGRQMNDQIGPDYRPFAASLPDPLQQDMTGFDIIMRLGRPHKVGGGHDFPGLGYQRPWMKYFPREDVQVRIEFEGERIWRVGIGKAFY